MSINRGLHGDQGRWDDIRVPLTRDKQGQSSKPDYDFTNMGLLFPQNDASEIVYLTVQMPHDRVPGTDLIPHLHYVQDEVTDPTFKIDYRWYDNGADPTGAFSTLEQDDVAFAYGGGSILQVATFEGPIPGSARTAISSILDIKVYRDDNAVTGDVLGKEFDLHYMRSGWGSRQQFAL